MSLIFKNREIDTDKHKKLVMLHFRNKFTLVATVAKTQHKFFVKQKNVGEILFSQYCNSTWTSSNKMINS